MSVVQDLLFTLQGHTDHVNDILYVPEEKMVITGSSDKHVRVFRAVDDSYQKWRIQCHFPCNSSITALAYHPENRLVAAGLKSGFILLLSLAEDYTSFRFRGEIDAHTKAVTKIAVIPSATTIISCGKDKQFRMFNWKDRTMKGSRLGSAAIHTFTLDLEGGRVFFGTMDHVIPVYRIKGSFEGLELICVLGEAVEGKNAAECGHTGSVRSLFFDPDTQYLFSGSFDSCVCGWLMGEDAGQLKLKLGPVQGGHRSKVKGIAWDTKRRILFSTGDDKRVIAWNASVGVKLAEWEAHRNWVLGCFLSAESGLLLTFGRDKLVKGWRVYAEAEDIGAQAADAATVDAEAPAEAEAVCDTVTDTVAPEVPSPAALDPHPEAVAAAVPDEIESDSGEQ
ncbi:hypothetical protein KIPB_004659 [Kipferlia bialata]|uniref:Uncharacterized protein n=1 Tax=Kipferlia bialata TaxID=797122 RepID=A0A9K3GID1_9EUKA|nr:hypothetical protein KIPB_004659 [Kipferlia bialata]|eukprot:g4659.t1